MDNFEKARKREKEELNDVKREIKRIYHASIGKLKELSSKKTRIFELNRQLHEGEEQIKKLQIKLQVEVAQNPRIEEGLREAKKKMEEKQDEVNRLNKECVILMRQLQNLGREKFTMKELINL